ncbi:MAG: tetratricopeptide repeat protein [Candidatus Scalindua sp.]|nr:tetratricopeptide repeat protein [Candidatus Scalindua sp.]
MNYILTITTDFLLLLLATPLVFAQGAGIEWEILNQEVMDLYRTGKYGRAVVVAKKALEVAEKNVGLNHPDVASCLENLAALYRDTKRNEDAKTLEQRAARIRSIQR